MRRIFLIIITVIAVLFTQAQNEKQDSSVKELEEVVISASKFPEKKLNVAQRIDVITAKFIIRANAQNTGDLLANTGNVFVQKSQQGGSSPVIRGFEASRVLLVVDGVRMNNLIYRSGHLQNAITVDQNMLESMEVLYGPASTIYGSDALGGVVHFRTKTPKLAEGKTMLVRGNGFARYSSANEEKSIHADLNLGWKKFAWLQSYTFSDFGDVKMGSNYPQKYKGFGSRDSFVAYINGADTVLKNEDNRIQKFSGYKQWDMLQKFLYKQNERINHVLNVQYSNTTNVPRYDRLQDKRDFGGAIGNTFRFAEWYYGPQTRFFSSYDLTILKAGFFDAVSLNLNYQDLTESRYSREFKQYDRLDRRLEKVKVAGFVFDTRKVWKDHELTVGVDGQLNDLTSTASRVNIKTGAASKLDTRYPDGDNNMYNLGVFAQHTYKFSNKKFVLNDGIRVQSIALRSTLVDTALLLQLPYTEIKQNNFTVTGNAGIIYLPKAGTKFSMNLATGFRAPNVDDLSKIFESSTAAQQLVVPNPNIKPEKTFNIDVGLSQNFFGKDVRFEISGFYTWFRDALVKAPFQLNGQDSVNYNGVRSQVLANSNANKAFLYGFSAAVYASFAKHFTFSSTFTLTEGKFETDNTKNSLIYEKQPNGTYSLVSKRVSTKPLDHIPPVFGKTSITYQNKGILGEMYALYNGWKHLDEFNPDGEDNAQYATADGMPGWITLNWRSSYTFKKQLTIQFAVENILDRNYRYFASGFSAPGRNIILAARVAF
ncbi:MAG: TonB-dependent receptor [Chitinophagaceae bacterium]|jgi:hemoglobin/transferrin/lactoferrin receptor protein|nr:TonB-dependent receptor [Chitinophagaceae bacterium]